MEKCLFARIVMIFSFLGTLSVNAQPSSLRQLEPWEPGLLDLHHISTGRGNATYVIFPDGTTLLIDAGEISDTHERTRSARNSTIKPSDEKRAPEWIVDYIRQFAPQPWPVTLDYALITHYHDDHFGEWDSTRPVSVPGKYPLTGITAVGDEIPIRYMLDRGYDFPVDLRSDAFRERYMNDEYHVVQTLDAYHNFIRYQMSVHQMKYDVLWPGHADQIVMRYDPASYPMFSVRNIAVNGKIWTGYAEGETVDSFQPGQYPGENDLSACLKITYGRFDYFTGGDISGVDKYGESDFADIESRIAPVIGPVDVATLNHHGNRDSQSKYYVRTLRPRVWIGQTWSSDHPGHDVLRRITSTDLYPGPRDVFSTDMLDANKLVIGDAISHSYLATHGHIVVRVRPGGSGYHVYVLNDHSTSREVVSEHGPFPSR